MDPDPDPDPAIFVIDLQDANKKQIKKKVFLLITFEGTFTSFFEEKKSKRSHKKLESRIFLHICLMKEGSGSGAESGSIPLLMSGSGGPKNMWIRWIRIRNRNTAFYAVLLTSPPPPLLDNNGKTSS
jgi:hypothetical protein